jgi:hypothetical protein
MSYDESDAEYDHYMEEWAEYAQDAARAEFYDNLSNQIINAFATSRLQAFYLTHPMVIQAPLDALNEARSLAVTHPSAALVFAVAATEVCFKVALLKPICYGLVHTESSAALLMELAIAPKEERLIEIMQKILAQHGGVDLYSFKRPGSTQTLWKEIQTLKKRRNAVLHRCEAASHNEATQAIGVAEAMIEVVFPATIARLGLHLHQGWQVCNDIDCEHPRI